MNKFDRRLFSLFAVAFAAASAAFTGCRTVDDVLVDYRANISAGRYAEAAKEPAELAAEGGGDALMWRLMAASAHDLAGDTDAALAEFDAAEDKMIENDKSSVFSQSVDTANAMMLNDKYFPYDGGGQDRIFTCLYKAVGYASKGDIAAARTELNRASQHQENWLWERRKDIAAADDRLAKESVEYANEKSEGHDVDAGQSDIVVQNAMRDGTFANSLKEAFGFDIFTSGVLDKLRPEDYQNPYLSHVCGVFRWLAGDGDQRGFFKDAILLRPKNSVVRGDLAACEKGVRPRNQVWVYVEDGLGPEREKWRIDLPVLLIPKAEKYVKSIDLALPRLIERPAAAKAWSVGGKPMEVIADVKALAKIEYDVYMRGAIAREITRTVIDVGIQVALGVAAENVSDWRTQVALKASQLAVAAYSAARRGADTRCWPTLPRTVYLARIPRPADGTLRVVADGIEVVQAELPAGNSMVFVRKPSPEATPSVKVVTWPPAN